MIIKVQSETNASVVYGVHVNHIGIAVTCTCPARTTWRRGMPCKHMRSVAATQDDVAFLARRGRYQVVGVTNLALMDAIYAAVRQGPGHRPPAAQVASLARIVDNVTENPDGDVERQVLGGLLKALNVSGVPILSAA
jgi:hypothetical protein